MDNPFVVAALLFLIGPFLFAAVAGLAEEIHKRYKANPREFWMTAMANIIAVIAFNWFLFVWLPSR